MKLLLKKYTTIDFNSAESGESSKYAFKDKKCLREIYTEQYCMVIDLMKEYIQSGDRILEIGSGGGFFKDLYPAVLTSDIRKIAGLDLVFNASDNLPFKEKSIDAIAAVHVFHHLPSVAKFLTEAKRILRDGGGLIFIEPYWSPFARFIYKTFHNEPFDTNTTDWNFDGRNPNDSNQALSYILLKRDRKKFARMFPEFSLVYKKPFGFIRYIMTGGIWLNQLLPNFMFLPLKWLEILLRPLMPLFAIHHVFVLKKNSYQS